MAPHQFADRQKHGHAQSAKQAVCRFRANQHFWHPNSLGKSWYSDPSLNGGQAHVVTYQGQEETLNLGRDPSNPVGSVLLGPNNYRVCSTIRW